jgi:hypothetical protein
MNDTQQQVYIDPADLRIYRDDSNNICADVEGRGTWQKVAFKLAFPYSDPDRFVSILHEGEQIGMVRHVSELSEDSQLVLREALARRYHIPEVISILDVREGKSAAVWTVETERGPRKLMVRDRHNFRRVQGGDTIIIDVDGNRFRLSSDRRLDPESQKLLDMYS